MADERKSWIDELMERCAYYSRAASMTAINLALEPFRDHDGRIKTLEALPRPEKGDKGDAGESIKGDVGEKGDPGEPGRAPTSEEIGGAVERHLFAHVGKYKGEPGEKGDKGDDGRTPSAEEIREAVDSQVEQHFELNREALTGEKGDKGDAGESVKGEKGDPGEPGRAPHANEIRDAVDSHMAEHGDKYRGDPGPKGDGGDKGDQGDPGENGKDVTDEQTYSAVETYMSVPANAEKHRGLKGDAGDKGDAGADATDDMVSRAVGDHMEANADAYKGDKGDPGESVKGDAGDKGDPGDKGDAGDKGDPGERGDKGDKGDAGADCTPEMVKAACREIMAENPDQYRGLRGDPGRRGEPGDSIKGEPGKDGAPGENGKIDLSESELIFEPGDGRDFTIKLVIGDTLISATKAKWPGTIYRDVWYEGAYEKGDMVTKAGNMWVALRDTSAKPGDDCPEDWRLAVRKGRDAHRSMPVK